MQKLLTLLLLPLFSIHVQAQEVYKWKDENGKVHYGDSQTSANNGKKAEIKVPPKVTTLPIAQPSHTSPISNTPKPMPRSSGQKSVPVDPSRVGASCKGIIDRIAAVKAGTPWKDLYQEFNRSCPGIAYECVTYKRQAENNKCTWVERSDDNVLRNKFYE